ncbi:MAG TPA: hypothetical protein VFT85_03455 [Acidimicrobiia bacterium]|nr:hypothetical protein [Acidimicrobiia bacterium]
MTDDERRIDREGIYIERDLADQVAIEQELDSNVEGKYHFPQPSRRRIAGWVYLVAGAIALVTIEDGWIVGLAFGALAAWHFLSSWPLSIDEHEALTTAASVVEFPVGHSSTTVRFHGWRSRPRWSVMLYAATEPPNQRGLVVVDAVTGEVVEKPFVETIAPL